VETDTAGKLRVDAAACRVPGAADIGLELHAVDVAAVIAFELRVDVDDRIRRDVAAAWLREVTLELQAEAPDEALARAVGDVQRIRVAEARDREVGVSQLRLRLNHEAATERNSVAD